MNLGDALAPLLEVLVLHIEEDLDAVDEHRLDAAHLVIEPFPELDQVDAPAFGEQPRLQQLLPEVAEKLAIVGAVEVLIRKVADLPHREADHVLSPAAHVPHRPFEYLL